MKKQAAIALIISLVLNSCTPNKPASHIPIVGEDVDSAAIARDTLQEKSLESSYEYAQTVIVSPKLVYDIRAYGGPPSHGEYAILRRGADNKVDTVVMEKRFGTIINAFTADLNNNGKEEIYVVLRKTHQTAASYVLAFEFDKNGAGVPLDFGDSTKGASINSQAEFNRLNAISDTIYLDGHWLQKNIRYYKKGSLNSVFQYYILKGNKFVITK